MNTTEFTKIVVTAGHIELTMAAPGQDAQPVIVSITPHEDCLHLHFSGLGDRHVFSDGPVTPNQINVSYCRPMSNLKGLPSANAGIPVTDPTPTQRAAITTVLAALEHANRYPKAKHPHVAYEACVIRCEGLLERLFFTAHCRDRQEQLEVLLAFSAIPNCGISNTLTPPTVTIAIQLLSSNQHSALTINQNQKLAPGLPQRQADLAALEELARVALLDPVAARK